MTYYQLNTPPGHALPRAIAWSNSAAPLSDPVLLDEVKDHLRITHSDEDAYLGSLIAVATSQIEQGYGLALIERSVDIIVDAAAALRIVRLPVRPVSEITQIMLTGSDGSQISLADSDYRLQAGLGARLIFPSYSGASGFHGLTDYRSMRVSARAGFGLSSNMIPPDIRHGLLLLIAYYYAHRGEEQTEPMQSSGTAALMAAYRDFRL